MRTLWRSTRVLGFLAVLAIDVSACHEGEVGRGLGAACDENTACREPYVCDYGRCRSACSIDSDCPDGACVRSETDPIANVCTVAAERGCQGYGCPKGLVCGIDDVCRTGCDTNHPCNQSKLCLVGACFDEVPSNLPDAGADAAQDATEEDGAGGTGGLDAANEAEVGPDAAEDVIEEDGSGGTAGQDAAEETGPDASDDADAGGGGTGGADAADDQDASAGSGGSGGQDASDDVSDEDVSAGGTGGADGGTGGSGGCVTEKAWYDLSPAGTPPSPRAGFGYAYDPVGHRMIIVGGFDQADPGGSQMDVWELSLEQSGSPSWTKLAPTGTPPPTPRRYIALVYDENKQRMLFFSGQRYIPPYDYSYYQDVYALELPQGSPPAWVALAPSGTPPPGRSQPAAILDQANHRMIVFAGRDPTGTGLLNDAWQLSGLDGTTPSWQQLQPSGGPPPQRDAPAAVYDRANQRMIVFGGGQWGAPELSDVWALTLPGSGTPAWQQLSPTGTGPAGRYAHTAVIDESGGRMIVFGGANQASGGSAFNDAFQLSLAGGGDGVWSPLLSATPNPAIRSVHGAVYDPLGNRMVIFGGAGASYFNDAQALGDQCVDNDGGGADSSADGGNDASPDAAPEGGPDSGTGSEKWLVSADVSGDPRVYLTDPNCASPIRLCSGCYGFASDRTGRFSPGGTNVAVYTGLGGWMQDDVAVISLAGPPFSVTPTSRQGDNPFWVSDAEFYYAHPLQTGCSETSEIRSYRVDTQADTLVVSGLGLSGYGTVASEVQKRVANASETPAVCSAAVTRVRVYDSDNGALLVEPTWSDDGNMDTVFGLLPDETGFLDQVHTGWNPPSDIYKVLWDGTRTLIYSGLSSDVAGQKGCLSTSRVSADGVFYCIGGSGISRLDLAGSPPVSAACVVDGSVANLVDVSFPVCAPGTTQCDGGALQTCQPNGHWDSGTACGGATPICSNGQCIAPCVVQLASGGGFGCARKGDGTLWCWGDNSYGQIGDGTSGNTRPTPVQVSALGTSVADVATGSYHACARKDDGTVWCWGRNSCGGIGDGTLTNSSLPVQVQALGTGTTGVWAGSGHACARKADDTLWCWGFNNQGQVGDGTTDGATCEGGSKSRSTPVQVSAMGTEVLEVGAGESFTCARKVDGTSWCWGDNDSGALGDGTTSGQPCGCCYTCKTAPVQVLGLGTQTAEIAGSRNGFACARKTDDSLWCWGTNEYGQLGNGAVGGQSCNLGSVCEPAPVQVLLTGSAVQVSAGAYHGCARKTDGTVWCWGDNSSGTTGDGTFGGVDCGSGHKCRPTPVQVAGLADAVQVAAGGGHACALKADGTVWCWGLNNAGQLGQGTTGGQTCGSYTCEPAPVQVKGLCP